MCFCFLPLVLHILQNPYLVSIFPITACRQQNSFHKIPQTHNHFSGNYLLIWKIRDVHLLGPRQTNRSFLIIPKTFFNPNLSLFVIRFFLLIPLHYTLAHRLVNPDAIGITSRRFINISIYCNMTTSNAVIISTTDRIVL